MNSNILRTDEIYVAQNEKQFKNYTDTDFCSI